MKSTEVKWYVYRGIGNAGNNRLDKKKAMGHRSSGVLTMGARLVQGAIYGFRIHYERNEEGSH